MAEDDLSDVRRFQRLAEDEEQSALLEDVDWITTRIAEAGKLHPTVTEAVSTQVEELLRGQLAERELSAAKLSKIGKALIADMVPPSPKTAANE